MKKNFTREIVLMANTSFSRQQLHENSSYEKQQLTSLEQLEEACWNGLIYEILPEIASKSMSGKNLYLWNVRASEFVLQLELSEFPVELERYFSINPNTFISALNYS